MHSLQGHVVQAEIGGKVCDGAENGIGNKPAQRAKGTQFQGLTQFLQQRHLRRHILPCQNAINDLDAPHRTNAAGRALAATFNRAELHRKARLPTHVDRIVKHDNPAMADQALAQSKNCMACHAVDKKLVGPAFKEVAAKYAGQKDAADKLAAKVIKGGSGVWGPVPMPANPQVNDADAKKLVAWVLSQK